MKLHLLALVPLLLVAGLGAALASCEAHGEGPAENGEPVGNGEDPAGGEGQAETEREEAVEMEDDAEDGEVLRRLAQVEELELMILKSFPVQVRATVTGTLPDACTEIDEVSQEREGSELRVTITTRRPADALCAQVIGHFQETVALEVHGLPAGTYEVVVNDQLRRELTFDTDNVLRVP